MLFRKMYRDIWSNKGSYLACLVLVVLGLTTYTSFSISSDNLELSKEIFYREQNFADGFAELTAMPYRDAEGLAQIEGIDQVSGRVTREVRVLYPESDIGIYLKFVSLELDNPDRVNDARLLEGNELRQGEFEVWVDNQFYDVHGLELGYVLEILAGEKAREITVEGYAMSPEFTYPLRTEAEIYPNPEQFGIAFTSRETMWNFFPDLQGRVNNLAFTLEEGADFDEVKDRLEPELEAYGLINLYSRDNQTSHLILSEEIAQLQRMAFAVPLMFLVIAALILYIMLKRLVEQQRGQIGILKAFGYSNREIMLHYLTYSITVGFIGGLVGGTAGIYLSRPLNWLLLEFFHVPEIDVDFSLYYFVLGVLISLGIFLAAGYQGCKYALKLKPAEAMRPPAPVSGRKTVLEKIRLFSSMLTIQGKMAVRNLARNRSRTAFLFIGVTLSCAVVVVTWSLNDLVDKLVFYRFEEVEVYHARVNFTEPVSRQPVERELAEHAEVTGVEPLAEVPVRLSHAWREESVVLLGILKDSSMYIIRDAAGRRIEPSEQGIILSERLAEKLSVEEGTSLKLASPYLRDNEDEQTVEVYRVIPQYLGMNAYMEITGVEAILQQGKFATSFMVNVGDERINPGNAEDYWDTDDFREKDLVRANIAGLRDYYRESDLVAGVDGTEEQIRETRELMETFGMVIYLYVLIGVVIAFSIIYSSSFIILSERNRELASMKVLGMTSREVFSVITFEQWFISFFAVLAGLPLAQAMMEGFSRELSTDLYTIPAELSAQALLMGALITAISIWIAQRFALRKVERLDLVEVLKTRE